MIVKVRNLIIFSEKNDENNFTIVMYVHGKVSF